MGCDSEPWVTPARAALPGGQLRPGRSRRLGVPCRQPGRPSAGGPDALRHRAPDPREREATRPIRPGGALAGHGGGRPLDGSPPPDRKRDLHHPTRRVVHGLVFPAHPVLRYSRRPGASSAPLVPRRRRRMWAGHGQQGGHGRRAARDVALRSGVHRRLLPGPLPPTLGATCSPVCDLGGPRGIAGHEPRGRAVGPRYRAHSVALRAHTVRRDCPLPSTFPVASSADPGLHVAAGPDAGIRRPLGFCAGGAGGGDPVGPPPPAVVGVFGSVVLPHPEPHLQRRAPCGCGIRAPHVPSPGGRGRARRDRRA